MPDDRTTVTELATALGTVGPADLATVLEKRPPVVKINDDDWDRIEALHDSRRFAAEFAAAFANGQAFLTARNALRGRCPIEVEWIGGRRSIGDDATPTDIRIDHVFQISCKYLSSNIANVSPARLFDGLLSTAGNWQRRDWYETTAPAEYRELYAVCRNASGLKELPVNHGDLTTAHRRLISKSIRGRKYPENAQRAYAQLCEAVSIASADRWNTNIKRAGMGERMLWRLLRIGGASYYLLGVDASQLLRVRVAGPGDWRQEFEFVSLDITAARAGQPQVNWIGRCRERSSHKTREVRGRAEIRWSHGRFRQPPEAKIYVETPVSELPGYFALT
ncbi:MAG: hypothetical protein SGJ13_05725 [Actinomycetota bacterium]|nr:hypothetical protein [Actinomycetota bacterium]